MSPAVSERFFHKGKRCLEATMSEAGTLDTGAKACSSEYSIRELGLTRLYLERHCVFWLN